LENYGLNVELIGKAGSREMLQTPALVLDLDLLERNIRQMAEFAQEHGVSLRPHAKTHKSVRIARMQIEAGALGASVATIGEAKIMIEAGISDVLVTSPVVHPAKVDLLINLNSRADGLMVVADHVANVATLDAAAAAVGRPLTVLVDLDVGIGRTGSRTPEDAFFVASQIDIAPNLRFGGVQAYAGKLQHIEDYADRKAANDKECVSIRDLLDRLNASGIGVPRVTGVGTGSHDIDAREGLFTEMQVGSYVFTDTHYNAVVLREGDPRPFEPSLFVRGTVVSVNQPGCVSVDTGLKRFATDSPFPPEPVRGVSAGCSFTFKGDEHGLVVFPRPDMNLSLGTGVEFITPHCDPTVNLHDSYHVVRGETLVDIWPVDARGAI
jgi:3-hydroxy-D-aspartate aldolase